LIRLLRNASAAPNGAARLRQQKPFDVDCAFSWSISRPYLQHMRLPPQPMASACTFASSFIM
jgi:hypothetical protein